jgi:uncharacterized protein
VKITNEVPVDAPPESMFNLITDVERVAHCLPGATLEGRDGDSYLGSVTVKVGPISARYRGAVRYLSVDEAARRVVLDARGRDEQGSGNAEARVDVTVQPNQGGDGGSVLRLDADLVVRGKVAQFGRGVLGDVSQGLMARFARNIGELLASERDGAGARAAVAEGEPDGARAPDVEGGGGPAPEVARDGVDETGDQAGHLDGLALVARPLLRRAAPAAAGVLVGAVVGLLGRRALGSSGGRRARGVLSREDLVALLLVDGTRLSVPVRRTIQLRR